MKATVKTLFAATILAAFAALSVSAQTQPAGRTAPPRPAPVPGAVAQPVPDGKIAIIDSDAFSDQKAGISRLVAAFQVVEREFKPRRDQLQTMRTRYDALVKEINDTKAVADQKALAAKADQADTLKNDIERQQQDGQRALEKRVKELTDPIFVDVGNALQAFAAQRGITLVFDVSKTGNAMMVVNNAVDITDAFIADYNQRNPASTAAATPPGTR
ncbi:MAG: outer membrane protein [Acidobacteriota bacterium]|jgi:Skp family chaperone for outer membrane proteins|nr:outer membrane protein [Acidobacteriota bacterium]